MAVMEGAYVGVLVWTLLVWAAMLLCPHHPSLHRLLRSPHLVLAPHLVLFLALVLPPLLHGGRRPSPSCHGTLTSQALC